MKNWQEDNDVYIKLPSWALIPTWQLKVNMDFDAYHISHIKRSKVCKNIEQVKLRINELFWEPDWNILSELNSKWYEMIVEISWISFTRWMHSRLDPFYYMPKYLNKQNGKYEKIDRNLLQWLIQIMMSDWNNYEEWASILAETLDMPVEEIIFMAEWI